MLTKSVLWIALWLLPHYESGVTVEGNKFTYSDQLHEQPLLTRRKRMMLEGPGWEKGILPYNFKPGIAYNIPEIKRIMALYEANSCIRFVEWNETVNQQLGLNHNRHVYFIKSSGCYVSGSSISCCTGHACVHEIGHSLGFAHEQNNPMRKGWMRVNYENLWPSNRNGYKPDDPSGWITKFPYDMSSMMHYGTYVYSTMGPSMTFLFPELSLSGEYYYMFMEVAYKYKCAEFEPCANFNLKCENDGFPTLVYGRCACKCPVGLDPNTGCSTPHKKAFTDAVKMPKGQYALPMPKTGCPDDYFTETKITHDIQGNNVVAIPVHIKGGIQGMKSEHHFCTRTVDDGVFDDSVARKYNWPVGQYCIYREGGECPTDFYPGSVEYESVSSNPESGEAALGAYNSISNTIEYCCHFAGYTNDPVYFPTKKPFALLKTGSSCQQVVGMRLQEEEVALFGYNGEVKVEGRLKYRVDEGNKIFHASHCYYSPKDVDCGGSVVLDENNRETTINVSSATRSDMECNWVIRGSTEKGTLVVDFDQFDLKKKNDGKCLDHVEVRHSRIGATGLKYCGDKIGHSIRTITNKVFIKFFTTGNSESSFKATIKWFPDNEACYDVADQGSSYAGKVNFTRMFKPCLPWTQVTKCYHHSFKKGDELSNLEENYCRNPDESFRPWCYTDTDGCQRNYCDVCNREVPHDQEPNCQKLKENGFCTKDAAEAAKRCASTCFDLISPTGPPKKFSEIECGPPIPPADGNIVGEVRDKYRLGEKVVFKCKNNNSSTSSTCLTDGKWTALDVSCRECPNSFILYNNACHKLIEDGKSFTYSEAKEKCKEFGGVISVAKNTQDSNFLYSIRNGRDYWIPVTDIDKEGTFVYEDGTKLQFSFWKAGEPNNWGGNEDCVIARGGWEWNDRSCNSKVAVICNIPLQDRACQDVQAKSCANHLMNRPSMCADFPEFARIHCPMTCGLCGTDDIKCSVQPTSSNVTVSTTSATISVGSFVTYSCEKYQYIQEGNEVRGCLSNGQLTGKPLKCADCPSGYVHFNGACYGLVEGRKFTFGQAKEECAKIGGFVAFSMNHEENNLISSLSLHEKIWIGASYSSRVKKFRFENAAPLSWTNYKDGKPSGDNCIMMDENKKWNSVKCSDMKLSTVCRIPKFGSDMCYDLKDKGLTYNGKVNFTVDHKPCANWADVTSCNTNAFKKGHERKNLEQNYCRNPDGESQPWCYTDSCSWNFCDVCGMEKLKDNDKDCKKLKEEGFCSKDRTLALQKCASTCSELWSSGSAQNYLEVKCDPPTGPPDGEIVGNVKPSYSLGEKVGFKCKRNKHVMYTTCLTSGDWSSLGFVCRDCPFGTFEFNNTCYKYYDKVLTHPEAAKECNNLGGSLPTPKSQQENDYLSSIRKGKYIWMGQTTLKDGSLVWPDGSQVDWSNWEKANYARVGACTYLRREKTWTATNCDYTWGDMRLVCATPKLDDTECRDFLPDECLRLLTAKTSMCQDFPEFVKDFCPHTCGICSSDDTGKGCQVQTSDPDVTVSTTDATIPVGSSVRFGCARFRYHSQGNLVRACLPDGNLTGTPVLCDDCPSGFESYQGSCYRFVQQTRTYAQAEIECKNFYGRVALPKDNAENNFVESLRNGQTVWVGATDVETEGTFVSKDQTQLQWSNWAGAGPKNLNANDDCTTMTPDKTWSDENCDDKWSFVCIVPRKSTTGKTVKVGSPRITKLDKPIPKIVSFTGENDMMRVKNRGSIVAWEFYSNSPVETSFQVWRMKRSNTYQLIGQNVITSGNDMYQRYDVPADQRIKVEPDDLIAIWNSAKGGVHFTICDTDIHPSWAGVSWGKRFSFSSYFNNGMIESFSSHPPSCCQFAFRAEIAITDE